MLPALNSASFLLQDSSRRFDLASVNLANMVNPDYQAIRPDGSRGPNDPAEQIVGSITSADTYKAGAALMRSSQEMLQSLIDIKA